MTATPTPSAILIALPIADRPATMTFYVRAFGWRPLGEPDQDGVPEPLQYSVDERTRLMFIPTGGFGWVLPGRDIASAGVSECLLGLTLPGRQDVVEVIEAMRAAGGQVLSEPDQQAWGFTGVATDLDGHAWQILSDPQG